MAGTTAVIIFALVLYTASLTVCDKCYYGKSPGSPATSCTDVLFIQPSDCYQESGYFWLKNHPYDNPEYAYCDLEHEGGGWRRVVYYHSDTNTSCPSGLVSKPFFGGNHTYCTKQANQDYAIFYWNDDQTLEFSQIRGYATLRVKTGGSPDGYSNLNYVLPELGALDGLEFMTGVFPGGYVRKFFSYVVGTKGLHSCPINGGDEYGALRRNYRENVYACDELDNSTSLDSEGFYQQELFSSDSCVQCSAGAPWFQKDYAQVIPNTRVIIRLVSTEDKDEAIYLTDLELYIR